MYEISLTFVQQYYINIKLLEYSTLIEHIKYETLKKKKLISATELNVSGVTTRLAMSADTV